MPPGAVVGAAEAGDSLSVGLAAGTVRLVVGYLAGAYVGMEVEVSSSTLDIGEYCTSDTGVDCTSDVGVYCTTVVELYVTVDVEVFLDVVDGR